MLRRVSLRFPRQLTVVVGDVVVVVAVVVAEAECDSDEAHDERLVGGEQVQDASMVVDELEHVLVHDFDRIPEVAEVVDRDKPYEQVSDDDRTAGLRYFVVHVEKHVSVDLQTIEMYFVFMSVLIMKNLLWMKFGGAG